VKARKGANSAPAAATGISGKNSGLANLTPLKPGESGNYAGRPRGDALMRKLLDESFQLSRKEAIAALCRRWASTKHVQDMVEIKARLDGELSKDTGGPGVAVIILNNQGDTPLNPEVFRERVLARMREDRGQVDQDERR
jgi:hypothetical protein